MDAIAAIRNYTLNQKETIQKKIFFSKKYL